MGQAFIFKKQPGTFVIDLYDVYTTYSRSKKEGISFFRPFYWLFFIIMILVITLINPTMVLLLLAIIYSLSGPVINVFRQYRKRKNLYKEENQR